MLLLGVVQAQAAGDVSFGSYDLLATEILTGSAASVTFSSLGDYATDYQHLQIRSVTKNTSNDFSDNFFMQFNGVTTSSYAHHRLFGNGSSVSSFASSSQTSMVAGRFARSTGNDFASGVIDILDPFETTKNTTIRAFYGSFDSAAVVLNSGLFAQTNAVSSINISGGGVNFAIGSRFSLYGLKAA
jgi:hypothetical protein